MKFVDTCPRCGLSDYIKRKLVLVERRDPANTHANWRVGCSCEGGLAVSDLKPELVVPGSMEQFTQGLYCERCGLGYTPLQAAGKNLHHRAGDASGKDSQYASGQGHWSKVMKTALFCGPPEGGEGFEATSRRISLYTDPAFFIYAPMLIQ